MKSCTHCGCDNEETAILCRKCGTSEAVVDPSLAAPLEPESSQSGEAAAASAEFIRLFFKIPAQEQFAVRCAKLIAGIVGERVADLRPETKWSEIFQWVNPSPTHTVAFTFTLKKEFGAYATVLLDDPEAMTFRDFVEYVCMRERGAA